MANLSVGDKAPAFALSSQAGKKVSLSDFKGKKVLLYFYPKADTPGCTKQACSIRDASKELKKLGAFAIGISPDEPVKQKKFDDKYSLGFPLLSDPDNKVARAYGAWGKKSMYGKTYEGIIRSSFVIDGQGKIVQASYNVKPLDTVPNATDVLGQSLLALDGTPISNEQARSEAARNLDHVISGHFGGIRIGITDRANEKTENIF